MEEISIFDGAINNENSFTELFRNILKFKTFRDEFLKLLPITLDTEKIEIDNFQTQASISRFGRPDLLLTGDDIELLFEIKVWNTGLTLNQPHGYFEYLTQNRCTKKGLVFIIPNNYHGKQFLIQAKNELKIKDSQISVEFIFWETIAEIIKNKELDKISPIFKEYLSFLTRWFSLSPIVLSPLNTEKMFGKEFIVSLSLTLAIVDNLYYKFKSRGFSIRLAKSLNFSVYGFEIKLPEDETLFFGVWWNYWLDSGNPVCLALTSNNAFQIEAFNNSISKAGLKPYIEFESHLTAYIPKESFLIGENEVENILEVFTQELKTVAIKVDSQ